VQRGFRVARDLTPTYSFDEAERDCDVPVDAFLDRASIKNE
jgi:hypothetical protein